jgi:hypothetical protein
MEHFEDLIRILSALAALMLVTAGVLALRKFPIPGLILSVVRVFYAVLWPAPAVAIVIFAALVIRARWILGFWPYPSSFDPTRVSNWYTPSALDPGYSMPIHSGVAVAAFVLGMFAILWAIPAYAFLRSSGRPSHPATLSILVAGWVSMFLCSLCDPGGFFSWFLG